jgi:zinc D-Ala-D-Ala carboxypeptidase
MSNSIIGDHIPIKVEHHLMKDSLEQMKQVLLGKVTYEENPDFEIIESQHTTKENIYLRKEAYAAYKLMYAAAKEAGIELTILSASRNFEHQKRIWERKWNNLLDKKKIHSHKVRLQTAKQILQFSSMPGTSRHHWGTDIDLVSLEPEFFATKRGVEIYIWLTENAPKFGFCQTYQGRNSSRSGYEDEPWHWSYLPIASNFFRQYMEHITYKDIHGFKGFNLAKELGVIQFYVGGIWGECK